MFVGDIGGAEKGSGEGNLADIVPVAWGKIVWGGVCGDYGLIVAETWFE